MTYFKTVALEHASRLINHGPTVLVTSSHGSAANIMAAAWSMPVEFRPPRIAIVIDKSTYTRELIVASGSFGICIPGAGLTKLTYEVGMESGRNVDKWAKHAISPSMGPVLGVPLLERGCVGWLECSLIREPHVESTYDTCFAEVVGAAADDRVFRNGHWTLEDIAPELQTIHHLGAGNFLRAGVHLSANSQEA